MPLFSPDFVSIDGYPEIEPSLKLDFANARALDPRITFTRASTATYVGRDGLIKYAGDDEARFDHDPATGESLGLLIEESRTNLLPQSQQYTSTYWNDLTTLPTGWTTTAGPAPDGTNTVTTWNSGNQIYEANVSYSVGPQYTSSVFVKDMTGGGGSVRLGPDHTSDYVGGDPRVTFQPSTQSFTTVGSGVQGYGYHEYPNGWYRVWFKYTLSVSDNIFNIVQLGAYNIGIWGAQVEEGASPTSYIPTSGSTVTRAVDLPLITGASFSSFYNQTEGTFVCSWKRATNNTNTIVVSVDDGTNNNRIELRSTASNASYFRFEASVAGTFSTVNINGILNNGLYNSDKAAYGYILNNFAASGNGSNVVDDQTTGVPTVNRLGFGNSVFGSQYMGTISSFYYYPKRLTNNQLQTLSQ